MIPHVQLVAVRAGTDMTPTTRTIRPSVFIIRHTTSHHRRRTVASLHPDFFCAIDIALRGCDSVLSRPQVEYGPAVELSRLAI